jgi:thiol-disulfide isomerase/thioredoxin
MMRRRALPAVLVGLLVLAGCATDPPAFAPGKDRPDAAEPSGAAVTGEPTTGVSTGGAPPTLAFTATTVDGAPFDARTLTGKPVVFWFWASWCPRCRAAAPEVAIVQREFDGRVHVVGVAGLGSGDDAMRQFVDDRGIGGFVNLADDEGRVWRRFGVRAQEYFVLLDARGQIVHNGPIDTRALRGRVTALAG